MAMRRVSLVSLLRAVMCFCFDGSVYRHAKFGMEINSKLTYALHMKCYLSVTINLVHAEALHKS